MSHTIFFANVQTETLATRLFSVVPGYSSFKEDIRQLSGAEIYPTNYVMMMPTEEVYKFCNVVN